MVWFKDPTLRTRTGAVPASARALGDELETDRVRREVPQNWFFNSGIPSLLVSFEGAGTKSSSRS